MSRAKKHIPTRESYFHALHLFLSGFAIFQHSRAFKMETSLRFLRYSGLFPRLINSGKRIKVEKKSATSCMLSYGVLSIKLATTYLYIVLLVQMYAKQETLTFRNILGNHLYILNWAVVDIATTFLFFSKENELTQILNKISKISRNFFIWSTFGAFNRMEVFLLSFQAIMILLSVSSSYFVSTNIGFWTLAVSQTILDLQNLAFQMLLIAMTNAVAEMVEKTERKTMDNLVLLAKKPSIENTIYRKYVKGAEQKPERNHSNVLCGAKIESVLLDSLKMFRILEQILDEMMQVTGPMIILFLYRSFVNGIIVTYFMYISTENLWEILNFAPYFLQMICGCYTVANLPIKNCEQVILILTRYIQVVRIFQRWIQIQTKIYTSIKSYFSLLLY